MISTVGNFLQAAEHRFFHPLACVAILAACDGGSFTHAVNSGVGGEIHPFRASLPSSGLPLPCRAELDGALSFDLHMLSSLVGAVGAQRSFSYCHPLW